MSGITLKSQQFSHSIRKTQKKEILAGMRSKQLQETSFSHMLWAEMLWTFEVIFKQRQSEQSEGKTHGGFSFLEHILTLKDSEYFCVDQLDYTGKTVRKPISMRILKEQLSSFPGLIKLVKEKISINLARFRNGGFSNQFASQIPSVLDKLKQCSQIRLINQYLWQFAEAFQRLSERNELVQSSPRAQINFGLFEGLTDCLIESSCFKPKQIKHRNEQVRASIEGVNEEMRAIQLQMSGPVCEQLMGCLRVFRERHDPLKLFINYIYIIGNIFVGLGKQKQQQEIYLKAQQIVLSRFVAIVREIQVQTVALESLTEVTQNFLETFSLIIWFVRNEILIKEELFEEGARLKNITPQVALKDNPLWMLVLSSILKALLLLIERRQNSEMAENVTIDASEAAVSSQVVSLLQILLFDFQITNREYFGSAVNSIFALRGLLKQVKHHEQLHRRIFDFYFGLTCAEQNQEYMETVSSEAIFNLQRASEYPNGFRICAKFLESSSRFANSKKAPVIEQLKKSIDSILSRLLGQSRENTSHFLFLLFSALKAEESVITPGPELMNQNRLRTLLELLVGVWEDEASKTDDLIVTLQILHFLSEKEELCQQLKALLLSSTYRDYLQFLAMNESEVINALVYKIHELLQIE